MTRSSHLLRPHSIVLTPPRRGRLRESFMDAAGETPEGASVQNWRDLHITLLKDIWVPKTKPKTNLPSRIEALRYPPFDIRFTDADVFVPDTDGSPYVVWLRPDGVSSFHIRQLRNDIAKSLREAGYNIPAEPFQPHMTIFRGTEEGLEEFLEKSRNKTYPVFPARHMHILGKRDLSDSSDPRNSGERLRKYEIENSFALRA